MKMVENSTSIGGPIFPPLWWKFSTPNITVEKSTFSNSTLKGGKKSTTHQQKVENG